MSSIILPSISTKHCILFWHYILYGRRKRSWKFDDMQDRNFSFHFFFFNDKTWKRFKFFIWNTCETMQVSCLEYIKQWLSTDTVAASSTSFRHDAEKCRKSMKKQRTSISIFRRNVSDKCFWYQAIRCKQRSKNKVSNDHKNSRCNQSNQTYREKSWDYVKYFTDHLLL